MKGKKSSIGPVAIFTIAGVTYILSGGIANANSNEGVIDIQSFLNSQPSEDTAREVRFSNIYDKLSSANIISGMHNVTSFFDGQDNRYDHRPADSNELFDIRLIYSGATTETKTSRLHFSFQFGPDYMFGNQPITFASDNIPYGPVVDVRAAINQNSGDLPLIDVPVGTTGPYGTGVLDIGTRLLADLNDDGIVNLIDFAILASYWGNHLGPSPEVSCVANISGPNGIPDGLGGYAVVDEYDLIAFAREWLCESETITQAMQTLPKDLYERLTGTANYIANNAGDSKLAFRHYQNQIPGLSGDLVQKLSKNLPLPEEATPLGKEHHSIDTLANDDRYLEREKNLGFSPVTRYKGKRTA